MVFRRARRASALCLALALLLPALLTGCGSGAQLRTGQRLMKKYLSGRGAAITESYVEALRPDGTKAVHSDFVKGKFRIDGEEYQFAVNTVTGEVWTSERYPAFCSYCAKSILSRLGISDVERVGELIADFYAPPGKAVSSEFPWARSYLGNVVPADETALGLYTEQALADGNVRILFYVACRADKLREDRWSDDALAGWENVEVELFGFPADEPLPSRKDFPTEYLDSFSGPCVTLLPDAVRYSAGE